MSEIIEQNAHILESGDWVQCFFAVLHSEYQYIKNQLMTHMKEGGYYHIAKEVSKNSHEDVSGQHIHIMAQMDDDGYHKMAKNIQLKYKLRGRATSAGSRQYGKTKEKLRNIPNGIAYQSKDGDYETNLPTDLVTELANSSYQKNTQVKSGTVNQRKATKSWMERCRDELVEMNPDHKWCHHKDMEIIRSHMRKCLGKQVKVLNKYKFRDMYWGIYQTLPMEYEESRKIDEALDDVIGERL